METRQLKRVLAMQAVNPTQALKINKVGFGESGEAETPDDTALLVPFIKEINSYQVNEDGSMIFKYTLNANEAVGKTIREVGLYCNNETTLVARDVDDVIYKTVDKVIEGEIKILP